MQRRQPLSHLPVCTFGEMDMQWLFTAITERLKALFAANVALDFEAQLAARDIERKAELLRRAANNIRIRIGPDNHHS